MARYGHEENDGYDTAQNIAIWYETIRSWNAPLRSPSAKAAIYFHQRWV